MLLQKNIHTLTILFALLTVLTVDVQGQNYALFNRDRFMTFTQRDTADIDSSYVFVKVDSVNTIGTDSIFYFNRFLINKRYLIELIY